jgi:hypothetical protein
MFIIILKYIVDIYYSTLEYFWVLTAIRAILYEDTIILKYVCSVSSPGLGHQVTTRRNPGKC